MIMPGEVNLNVNSKKYLDEGIEMYCKFERVHSSSFYNNYLENYYKGINKGKTNINLIISLLMLFTIATNIIM